MQDKSDFSLDTAGLGLRLRHERARLGWTQEDMAVQGSVTRVTQGRYERGDVLPDLAYMAALQNGGVNFLYICCGAAAVEVVQKCEGVIALGKNNG